MIDRTINALLFLAIVSIFALGACLDAPSDHNTEMAQAQDLQAAIKNEAASARFTRAAAKICGNADYTLDPDGAVHCVPRKPRGPGVVLTRMGPVGVQP